nr:methyl-accepting chemotaxis protein [Paenibacillus sp. P96]
MNILEALITALPYLEKVMREKLNLALFDRTQVVAYRGTSDFDMGFKPGYVLVDGFKDFAMLKNGNEATMITVPKETFGVELHMVCAPVHDENGDIVAVFAAIYNQSNQSQLDQMVEESRAISDQLVEMVQHVAAHSQELQATSEQILQNSKQAVENSSKINQVATFIKEISDQTNLLGLNAAIEAARVGEAGAGFGVVAQEVRKLSVESKQATTDIEAALKDVQNSMRQMEHEIAQIAASSQEQASLVGQFTEVIERMQKASDTMKELAGNLTVYNV